jgi:hypothetical protein
VPEIKAFRGQNCGERVVEVDPLTLGWEWGRRNAKAAAAGLMRRSGLASCAFTKHTRMDGWFFRAFLFMLRKDDLDSHVPAASSS